MSKPPVNAGPVEELNAELKNGAMKKLAAGGYEILLCRVDDAYYAIEDLCTHEDYPLYLGCLKGEEIECSLHGACFNVKTGKPTAEPGEIPLKTFPVSVVNGNVLIEV